MVIKAQLGVMQQKVLSVVYRRQAPLAPRGPIVSFTFDDFPRSALNVGGRILSAHGVRATYYTAIGLMNTVNHLGDQFRREDLDVLLRDGHELASHTFGHVSCRKVSSATFEDEVERGRRAIEELTGRSDFGNFAFPFGAVTIAGKKIASQHLSSSRSIWGGVNGPDVDLNLLRANSLYGDIEKCAEVRELILENERRRGWLIFYSHDVSPTPSRYGCSPELLEYAVSFVSQRCARILTVAEVVAELGAGPAQEIHV